MGRMTPTPYTVESPLLHTHILHHQRLESPLEQLNVSMAEQDKRNAEHMTTQSLQPQTHYTNKCKHTHIYLWVPPTGYVVCMDPYVNMHVFVVVQELGHTAKATKNTSEILAITFLLTTSHFPPTNNQYSP